MLYFEPSRKSFVELVRVNLYFVKVSRTFAMMVHHCEHVQLFFGYVMICFLKFPEGAAENEKACPSKPYPDFKYLQIIYA